jgi:hypothetical protein
MLSTFAKAELDGLGGTDISDELERGKIVLFPDCPIDLPGPADLDFLRQEMPKRLNLKNVSYHPEADKVLGVRCERDIAERVHRVLKEHSSRVQSFLTKVIPTLAQNWKVGTSSFRPMQEKGRNLSAHASNELVHIDAGAYGATHGDRIIRFFVNVNTEEPRVWITKGAFPDLYRRFGQSAGVWADNGTGSLDESMLDWLRTRTVNALAHLVPPARLLDSSPYDRAMRRFHNFMKDTPAFQSTPDGHEEFSFKPFSAWMVFTDMVSHACTSGQHAFVDTFVVPLENCRLKEMAPINILRGS